MWLASLAARRAAGLVSCPSRAALFQPIHPPPVGRATPSTKEQPMTTKSKVRTSPAVQALARIEHQFARIATAMEQVLAIADKATGELYDLGAGSIRVSNIGS